MGDLVRLEEVSYGAEKSTNGALMAASPTTTADALHADYVVVGAGAMGMAFVDEILTHDAEASVVLVDQHAKPGGHWNDAYPFVRLHQPSAFYGVSSVPLGSERIDSVGLNAGLAELASGAEVCAYYDHLMQRRFLPSGRVAYLPSATYRDGLATIAPSGRSIAVTAERSVVNASYMAVKVPSVTPPAYEVAPDATVIAPNELPALDDAPDRFVIIGAGKTAFDAILWLLERNVDTAAIEWIVPRDSWLLNRAIIQPGASLRIGDQTGFVAEVNSAEELFARLETERHFLRIDPSVEPTMYRCATVTEAELEQLRRVDRVHRGGRVQRVDSHVIELDQGQMATTPNTVHVNCTADGLERRPARAVFATGQITLQTVRACQQVFSAGLIARVETLTNITADDKNELATVIPHPDTPHDYLTGTLAHLHNMGRWSGHAELSQWLIDTRLSPSGGRTPDLEVALQAVANLERFVTEAPM